MDWKLVMDIGIAISLITAIGVLLGAVASYISVIRDNKLLHKENANLKEQIQSSEKVLSKEHDELTDKIQNEHAEIKEDTRYVHRIIAEETYARQTLFENTKRAKEILDTMDVMKEVVNQNAKLNTEVAVLRQEVQQNQNNAEKFEDVKDMLRDVRRELVGLQEYQELDKTTQQVIDTLSMIDDKLRKVFK